MKSDARFALVHNVACSNNVFSLGVSASLGIAAAVWIGSRIDSIVSVREYCLRRAVDRFLQRFPSWELWLVVGHRTVQPDNRLMRHFRLWKSLEKRGLSIPTGNFTPEMLIVYEDGIRFFGAVQFAPEPEQLDKVCSILTTESAVIVAADRTHGRRLSEQLTMRGWSHVKTKSFEEILESVCSQGGVVIDVFGEFDDAEAAAAVMGRENIVTALTDP